MSLKDQQLNGVESEVPCSCRDNLLDAEAVLNGHVNAGNDSKVLNVSPVAVETSLEVDSCTGLPRLPIEPVVDSEEEPETPCLTVSSWNFNPKSGYLTEVMSNVLSSPSGSRTVTFKEDSKVSPNQKGMDHSSRSSKVSW